MASKGAKADLLYGSSGTLKTTNIGKAALWAHKKYGKPTRLVSADGGGWQPIESLVSAGIVIPWMIRDHDNLIETIDRACQGYWPEDAENPKSRLMSPFIIRYSGKCPKCGEEASSAKPIQQFPCPKCKTITNATMSRAANPANDLSTIALICFEGLTSFGDAILSRLLESKASLSQDPSYVWKEGETDYAGGNMTYFGFLQQRLPEFVSKTNSLPVEKVIWTALEGRGIDEASKAPMFGPLFTGGTGAQKLTGKAGAWFGNMLHFEAVETQKAADKGTVDIEIEHRMYLRPHAEPTSKAMFHCKTRAPFQFAKELPNFMTPDVGELYDKIDEMQQRAVASLQQSTAVATK